MKLCRNVHKRICLLLALFGTVCALPGSANGNLPPATPLAEIDLPTDETVRDLQTQIQWLRREQSKLEDEIEAAKGSVEKVSLQKELADRRLAFLAEEIDCFTRLADYYNSLLIAEEAELALLQARMDADYKVLTVRLRQLYEEGRPGLLEQFSRSDSLLSLLVEMERNGQVEEYDRLLMESMEKTLGEMADIRTRLDTLRTDRASTLAEQAVRQQLFHVQLLESGSYLQSLKGDLNRFSYYLQQAQAGEQRAHRAMDEAGAALETKLAAEGNGWLLAAKAEKLEQLAETIRGAMDAGSLQKGREHYAEGAAYIWPLAITPERAPTVLASMGFRTYQEGGTLFTDYHSGADLSADYNTAVVASASGVVLAAGFEYGCGNYIAIRHDDGSETRYAHLAEITVRAGDYVIQGEQIGSAGTGGNSSGPGCHFELWIDGSAADPEVYLIRPTLPVGEDA